MSKSNPHYGEGSVAPPRRPITIRDDVVDNEPAADVCRQCFQPVVIDTDGSGRLVVLNEDGSYHPCEEPPAFERA